VILQECFHQCSRVDCSADFSHYVNEASPPDQYFILCASCAQASQIRSNGLSHERETTGRAQRRNGMLATAPERTDFEVPQGWPESRYQTPALEKANWDFISAYSMASEAGEIFE
jgi:hypothetical protein